MRGSSFSKPPPGRGGQPRGGDGRPGGRGGSPGDASRSRSPSPSPAREHEASAPGSEVGIAGPRVGVSTSTCATCISASTSSPPRAA
eukprot:2384329-Pyramimonas_sp.AAC.1